MNKLKEARKKCGLTQEELAERSGVSRSTIVMIERGNFMDVKLSTLKKLSDALGKKIESIFLF